MKPFTIIAIIVCTLFSLTVHAETNVPHLINYQGKLTDSNGNSMITKDYSLSFSIYSGANALTPVWGPQIFDGINDVGHGAKVPVVRGYFNVILGPVDVNNISINQAFESFSETYVEISFFEDNAFVPVVPRQRILSTPYAMVAENANHAKVAYKAIHHSNTLPVGTVVPFFGVTLPLGWLFCDGSLITDEDKYRQLKTTLGSNILPDLSETFIDESHCLSIRKNYEYTDNLCINGRFYSSHGSPEDLFDHTISRYSYYHNTTTFDFWCAYEFNKDTLVTDLIVYDFCLSGCSTAYSKINISGSLDSFDDINTVWEQINYSSVIIDNKHILWDWGHQTACDSINYKLNTNKKYKLFKIQINFCSSILISEIIMKKRLSINDFNINYIIKY